MFRHRHSYGSDHKRRTGPRRSRLRTRLPGRALHARRKSSTNLRRHQPDSTHRHRPTNLIPLRTSCVVASPSPSVTLLRNLRARQLTNQAIELHRPLILQLIATLLQAMNINASIHTLKSITHLSRRKHTLASGDHHHRHLQARHRLIHIYRQSVTEERNHSIATARLVRAGINIFNQFVSDQARIVIALAVIVPTNSRARSQHIIDRLTNNWQAQRKLHNTTQWSRRVLSQYKRRWCHQHKAIIEPWMTISIRNHKSTGHTMRHHDSWLTNDLSHEITDQVSKHL